MADTSRRNGVSLEEVAEAFHELIGEGLKPSVRLIRERVGRGSNTTLLELLNKVEAGIETPEEELEQFGPRLHNLCREMIAHMKELAQSHLAQQQDELEQRRENMIQRVNAAQQAQQTAEKELKQERSSNAELRKRISELEKARDHFQKALNNQTVMTAEANASLKEMKGRAERAEADAAHARKTRDHFEERMADQREKEQASHAEQLASLQRVIDIERRKQSEQAEQLVQLGSANQDLRAELSAEQIKFDVAATKISELDAQIQSLRVVAQQREESLSNQAKLLDTARDALGVKAEQVYELQQQLIEKQKQFDAARDADTTKHKSAIAQLVEHANRLYERARQAGDDEGSLEQAELRAAHSQVVRLFG